MAKVIHCNDGGFDCAEVVQRLDSKAAGWIASDALRELTGEKIQGRLRP